MLKKVSDKAAGSELAERRTLGWYVEACERPRTTLEGFFSI
jgi:hypothetical protein